MLNFVSVRTIKGSSSSSTRSKTRTHPQMYIATILNIHRILLAAPEPGISLPPPKATPPGCRCFAVAVCGVHSAPENPTLEMPRPSGSGARDDPPGLFTPFNPPLRRGGVPMRPYPTSPPAPGAPTERLGGSRMDPTERLGKMGAHV